MRNSLITACFIILTTSLSYGQQKGYYRTPCNYKNTVVFTAEGDLWKYDVQSKVVSRLTTNEGVEDNPAISPDGKWLAFTLTCWPESITERQAWKSF